jgi:uncharacterized protein
MANSCRDCKKLVNRIRNRFTMLNSISQDAESQGPCRCRRVRAGWTVREDTGQIRDLRDPATVGFAIELNGERHSLSPFNTHYHTIMPIDRTRDWVERFVVGFNICPFAKPILERIRYVVAESADGYDMLDDLDRELRLLVESPRTVIETTLLILPNVPAEFDRFNDLLHEANGLLRDRKLVGVVQLVGFHPRFRFADSDLADPANAVNRSPFPMIHLLREVSVAEVAEHGGSVATRNAERLRKLSR